MTNWCLVSSFERVPSREGLQRWKRLRFRWAWSGKVRLLKSRFLRSGRGYESLKDSLLSSARTRSLIHYDYEFPFG